MDGQVEGACQLKHTEELEQATAEAAVLVDVAARDELALDDPRGHFLAQRLHF